MIASTGVDIHLDGRHFTIAPQKHKAVISPPMLALKQQVDCVCFILIGYRQQLQLRLQVVFCERFVVREQKHAFASTSTTWECYQTVFADI